MVDNGPPFSILADDLDELDGCDIDYAEDPLPDEDLDIFILSPEGDTEKVAEYQRLFCPDMTNG